MEGNYGNITPWVYVWAAYGISGFSLLAFAVWSYIARAKSLKILKDEGFISDTKSES